MKLKIETKLKAFYIQPNTVFFQAVTFLNKNANVVLLFVFILLTTFPFLNWWNEMNRQTQLETEFSQLQQEISQQKTLYQALISHQKQFSNQDAHLAKISQQVEQLLRQNQVMIENVQWHSESGKTLTINASQQAIPLFNFLQKLTQFSALRTKELTLTKRNEKRLIQLNMSLSLAQKQGGKE